MDRTLTGRLRSAMNDTPAFQNISAPKTVDGQRAAKEFRAAHTGAFHNFMIQQRQAMEAAALSWQRLLDEGYIEVMPGVLRHPLDGTVVERG